MTFKLTTSQRTALAQLHELLAGQDLRPTYVMTGPPGSGKSSVGRLLGGDYHNFALEWLEEFFATRNPLFPQAVALGAFLLDKVAVSSGPFVVLDGLEPTLVGFVPGRRQEIAGVIQSLLRQTTGRPLVLIISSAPGSPFLAPGFADTWQERAKVVTLSFTEQDAAEVAEQFGITPEAAADAGSLYDLTNLSRCNKE